MLGISPHTVDQRIMLARAKLQVSSRNEVAQAYRRLIELQGKISNSDVYGKSIYGSPDIAHPPEFLHGFDQEADETAFPDLRQPDTRPASSGRYGPLSQQTAGHPTSDDRSGYYHVLPEAFDGRAGTLLRLGAIAMITVFVTLVILGGLAMYSELSHMLDG